MMQGVDREQWRHVTSSAGGGSFSPPPPSPSPPTALPESSSASNATEIESGDRKGWIVLDFSTCESENLWSIGHSI